MTVKHLEVVDTDKNLLCSFRCHLLLHSGVIMLGIVRNMLNHINGNNAREGSGRFVNEI
jgi:hypothetical protein